MTIFSNMVEYTIKEFIYDFSIVGDSFEDYLAYFSSLLKRCANCNLVLNWEKCRFMVKEKTMLGHKILKKGTEVDKTKI